MRNEIALEVTPGAAYPKSGIGVFLIKYYSERLPMRAQVWVAKTEEGEIKMRAKVDLFIFIYFAIN